MISQTVRQVQVLFICDDTSILYSNKNLKPLELEVNVELNKLCEWLTANKLTLNAKKSNYVKEAIILTNDTYF